MAFFARQLLKDLRLVGGYDLLYPKLKTFLREHLFQASPMDLEDPVVLRKPVRARSRQTGVRPLQGRQQRADRARQRRDPHRRPHPPARHAALPKPAAWLCRDEEVGLQRMVGEAGAGGLELASKRLDRKAETVNTAGHEDHLRPARSAAAQGQGCRR